MTNIEKNIVIVALMAGLIAVLFNVYQTNQLNKKLIEIIAGEGANMVEHTYSIPKLSFSPNGDGIEDFVIFKKNEIPIKIYSFLNHKLIRTITAADEYRWDGKMSNGMNAEIGLYAAESAEGKKLVIQLNR